MLSKGQVVISAIGAMLLGWSGTAVSMKIGLAGAHQADLALFAIGIIFIALAPIRPLAQRVRALEQLASARSDPSPAPVAPPAAP